MWKAATVGAFVAVLALAGCSGDLPVAGPPAGSLQPASQQLHPMNYGATVPSIALPPERRLVHQSVPAMEIPSRFAPDLDPNKFVYTAQLYGDDLKIYRQRKNGSLNYVRKLRGFSAPQGMVATYDGHLYVANSGASNVLVYRSTSKGPKGPIAILQDRTREPVGVSSTPSRQLVAVSNFQTTLGGSGSVSVYTHRKPVPEHILTYGHDRLQGIGIAVDNQRNCYWSFNDVDLSSGFIVEFVHCDGKGVLITSGLQFAGGIAFDQHGNMYYTDQLVGVYKCTGTANCSVLARGFGDPVSINFDRKQKRLWVADATGYLDALDPVSGKVVYSRHAVGRGSDPPFGIAPSPGSR